MISFTCRYSYLYPHNRYYVVLVSSAHEQSQSLNLPAVHITALHCIKPGGIYARMPENIRKADNILLHGIICPRKQMTQIMRKNLCRRHTRIGAERFHHLPYIAAVKRFAAARHKHRTAPYAVLLHILPQHFAEFTRQKNCAHFSFAVYIRLAVNDRFHRDKTQLTHAESAAAQSLQHIIQTAVISALCRREQTHIFVSREFPVFVREYPPLNFQRFYAQVMSAAKCKKTVQRRYDRVGTRRGIFSAQIGFVVNQCRFCQFSVSEPTGKKADITDIFFCGVTALFFIRKRFGIFFYQFAKIHFSFNSLIIFYHNEDILIAYRISENQKGTETVVFYSPCAFLSSELSLISNNLIEFPYILSESNSIPDKSSNSTFGNSIASSSMNISI